MKLLQKKLADQKKQEKTLAGSLDILYTEYGEALFMQAVQTGIPESYRFASDIQHWKLLKDERTIAAENVINIKTALSRQKEIQTFYQEVGKILHQQKNEWKKLQEEFSVLFFHTYKNDNTIDFLKPVKESILPFADAVGVLEDQQYTLEDKKETASAVKKILIQAQLITLQKKINRIEKNIDCRIIQSCATIVEHAVIQYMYEQNSFPEPLTVLYRKMKEAENKQNDTELRKQILANEKEQLLRTLHAYDESKQPKKTIAALNISIKKIDRQMTAAEKMYGMNIADILYTEEGDVKESDVAENTTQELQEYAKTIGEKRIELAQCRVNIEYLETAITIKREEAACAALNKTIQAHKKSIAEYEVLIKNAEAKILETQERITTLSKKNTQLSPDFLQTETSVQKPPVKEL